MDTTIVIPFLNEIDEPLKTINSIYETTSNHNKFEVYLINDDYRYPPFKVPSYSNLKLIRNPHRVGVTKNRDLGVMLSDNENIVLLDAHMRFYNNYWLDVLTDALNKNPDSIITPVSKSVKDDKIDFESNSGRGCKILMKNYNVDKNTLNNGILSTKWDVDLLFNDEWEIPCVMGGCYAIKKMQYEYLNGFEGMHMYGCSEVFLSLKNWMMGGKCLNIPYLYVGHKYKQPTDVNYEMHNWYKVYNKMHIIFSLFPNELILGALNQINAFGTYKEAKDLMKKNYLKVIAKRAYYQAQIKKDINWFCDRFNLEKFWSNSSAH